jgi:peptide-methionine (S)-S-oxide reductase
VGTQYRSAVFYHLPEQRAVAEDVIARITAEKLYPEPVVTRAEPASTFYIAEDHQQYFARNPYQGYCQFVVAPKVAKFRKHFFERLKKQKA